MTPITIPAMAPPLSPPPDEFADAPRMMPEVPTGVSYGCVVVAVPVPVCVIVVIVLEVGRSGAPGVAPAVLVRYVVTV